MGGCLVISKILFLIFNAFFFLLGLLMLGFGIALKVSPGSIFSLSKSSAELTSLLDFMAGDTLQGVGIFMVILGCVVTAIALVGFVACLAESRIIFAFYILIIVLIMLAEIIIIIMLAGFPDKVKQFASSTIKLDTDFKDDIQLFPNGTMSEPTQSLARKWAIVQTQLGCCAITGPSDYQSLKADKRQVYIGESMPQTSLVPLSCCSVFRMKENNQPTTSDFKKCVDVKDVLYITDEINKPGCYDSIQNFLITYWQIPIGIAAATIGLQVVLIILASCVVHRISRK